MSTEYTDDRLYSKEHEWIKVEDGVGTIGITDFAQDSLGDVVFLELPDVGRRLASHEVLGTVESRLYPLDSGKGIDFDSVFSGLKAIDYTGYVTLHQAFDGKLEPEEAVARSAQFLRNLM